MKNNIILVGFMGGGKSLVSKKLAQELNARRVSIDEVIESQEKRTISQIFKDSGEAYFRTLEKKVIKDICKERGIIIDCGGGAFLDPENIAILKANGITFYLSTSPEIVYQRVKNNKSRPLLNVEDPLSAIRNLMEERKSRYNQAHFTIHTDSHTVEDTAKDILSRLPA